MNKTNTLLLITTLLFGVAGNNLYAKEMDWSLYGKLLNKYLKEGERDNIPLILVDYEKMGKDSDYKTLINDLEAFDPEQLKTEHEQLAFYINAYNILAIKMVIDHWPLESIKDAGSLFESVWKKPVGKIAGEIVSLDEIEHEILRDYGEPRIHVAIVCASVSCPDLRNEPYTSTRLDQQLTDQAIKFLKNKRKGMAVTGNEVTVSKIFSWFEEDFDVYDGVEGFISKYSSDLPEDFRIVDYFDYNWKLNY